MRSALIAALLLVACGPGPAPGFESGAAPITRPETIEVVSRQALARAASGVTVDETGRRFVWVRGEGLFELKPEGLALVLSMASLSTQPESEVEDVVLLGGDLLALVAKNDGFIVSLSTGRLHNTFCYLPGFVQQRDPAAWQLSRGIAFDSVESRIYVQPRTFSGTGELTASQLGLFDIGNAGPLEWQPFSAGTDVGGLAVTARRRLVLGQGTKLARYDASARAILSTVDVSAHVTSIDGLAFDATTQTLVVLDDVRHEVVELRLP